MLVLLLNNHALILTANNNIALCILQDVMSTRAHILPTRKWANFERLLIEPDPPAHGPFHGCFKHWANSQGSRNVKDQVVALLNNYGVYDPAMVSNPSMLQSLSRTIKDEMDTAKASKWTSLEAKCLYIEACGHKNVHQEKALGAVPRGYGIDAPCVAGTNKACQRQSQDARITEPEKVGIKLFE